MRRNLGGMPIRGGFLGLFFNQKQKYIEVSSQTYKYPNTVKVNSIINPIIWDLEDIWSLLLLYREVHTVRIYTLLGPSSRLLPPFTAGEQAEGREIAFPAPGSNAAACRMRHRGGCVCSITSTSQHFL